jgi:glycerophosphoryl diester phosphodiesterase
MDGFECYIRLSSDGVPIVIHDETLKIGTTPITTRCPHHPMMVESNSISYSFEKNCLRVWLIPRARRS